MIIIKIRGTWKLGDEWRSSKRQHTEKSAGDLRRFAVTQTQVKGHLLTVT